MQVEGELALLPNVFKEVQSWSGISFNYFVDFLHLITP